MISNLNWGTITSPDTFQALVGMMIGFEDPGARTFDRPGPDAGQDATSSDGLTAYQAKFHASDDPAQSFADARAELVKITKYRSATNPNEPLWRNVRRWILVSPVAFNAADRLRWAEQIVPAFQAVGLEAEVWSRSDIELRLVRQPQVVAHFFHGAELAFLPLPDARRIVRDTDAIGVATVDMVGREDDLAFVEGFLSSSKRILLLHGPGGVGKTRLLIDGCAQVALKQNVTPLWANVRVLTASLPLAGLVAERPTLVLADEPDKSEQIDALLGLLLGGQRTRSWKAIISVRSPKDPVLQRLRRVELKQLVDERELKRLASEPATQMASKLLKDKKFSDGQVEGHPDTAKTLAKIADRFPIWIAFAARELMRSGSIETLPKTTAELADQYIREILEESRERERDEVLLRWAALLAPLNVEDATALDLIVEYGRRHLNKPAWSSSDVRKGLDALVRRKVLFRRGAWDRLHELKPDVLRDRLLDCWLIEAQGPDLGPSTDASMLLARVVDAALARGVTGTDLRLLSAMGRLEMTHRLAGDKIGLLDSFVTPLLNNIETLPANGVKRILAGLSAIAFYRPSTLSEVSRRLRAARIPDAEEKSLFSSRLIGRDDVLLALPWLLFDAARGATDPDDKRALLRELLYLGAEEERIGTSRKQGLPNDGKRVGSILPRIVVGGPEVLSDFGVEAEAVGQEILDELARNPILDGRLRTALSALIGPLLSIEQEHAIPEEHYRITIQRYVIVPGSVQWRIRSEIIASVRRILNQHSCPPVTASALWKLLADAHRSLLSGGRAGGDEYPGLSEAVLEELTWTRNALRDRVRDPKETQAVREMWDWHRRFDPDAGRKRLAEECEELIAKHPVVRELGQFLDVPWDDDWLARVESKADELQYRTLEEITRFVAAIEEYSGDRVLEVALSVAGALGYRAHENATVLAVTNWVSTAPVESAQFRFAANVLRNRLRKLRELQGGTVALDELRQRCAAIGDGKARARLWAAALSRMSGPPVGNLTTDEVVALRNARADFEAVGELGTFLALVSENCWIDWSGFQTMVSSILAEPHAQRIARLEQIIRAIDFARIQLRRANPPSKLPTNSGRWLLDQLVSIDDIDHVAATTIYHLRELLEEDERPTADWVVSVLESRRRTIPAADVAPTHYRLSSFARPIRAESVAEAERSAIRTLLGWVAEKHIGYRIPEYVRELDPGGAVVIGAVIERVTGTDQTKLWPLARVAGAYPEQSKPWREMASPICSRVLTANRETRISVFGALEGQRMRSFSAPVGEVAAIFYEAVSVVRKCLEEETDNSLREYWRWRLAAAEAEFEGEKQRVREERRE